MSEWEREKERSIATQYTNRLQTITHYETASRSSTECNNVPNFHTYRTATTSIEIEQIGGRWKELTKHSNPVMISISCGGALWPSFCILKAAKEGFHQMPNRLYWLRGEYAKTDATTEMLLLLAGLVSFFMLDDPQQKVLCWPLMLLENIIVT